MATIISTKTSGVGGLSVTGDASGILQLASADGTTALTIDSSQNVGIGTSSPSAPLDIKVGTGNFTVGLQGAANAQLTSSGNLRFNTTAGTTVFSQNNIESVRIDSSGNVGIGTSSPFAKLNVKTLDATNAAMIAGTTIGARFSSDSLGLYIDGTDPTGNVSYQPLFTGGSVFGVRISGVEKMRIDSSGNVGIGTSSPSAKLDISNGMVRLSNAYQVQWFNGATQLASILGDSGSNLTFQTGSSNTERARINASGQFLIGTISNYFGENLTVYNNNASTAPVAFFYNPNPSTTGSALNIQTEGASGTTWKLIDGRSAGGAGRFFVFGNGNVQNSNNSYGAISDESVKESIVDATHKLDDLCKVKIRNFNLKNDENKIKQIGVVAQELEQIFPAMVEEVDGLKGVKYSIFVPILVKAIQELKAIIDTQNARITTLEGG